MISVYTDGASGSKGGKPGGFAWVIILHDTKPLLCGNGGLPSTTNNEMELLGALRGLQAVRTLRPKYPHFVIELVSDSQYTLGSATTFVPSKNIEIVTELKATLKELGARTRWVRGHNGNRCNEMADKLAGLAKEEQKLNLIKAGAQLNG